MLDELILGGEIQETSKKNVLKGIAAQDLLQEVINRKHKLKRESSLMWNWLSCSSGGRMQ